MQDKPYVVNLQDVYKIHRTPDLETSALNGLHFQVQRGEFVAVMGPSGSGKSTLLNVIGLIDEPSRGSYRFLGQEVTSLSQSRRTALRKEHMGFIFQSFNLIDELTAFENVELPLVYQQLPKRERRERVERALAELEIGHRGGHYPRQLSGGQQQRVAIARAIVTEPSIILADEPTGNLDSENSRTVIRKLQEFHEQGATILMVTHSARDAAYASRTVEFFDGKVLLSEAEYLARTNNNEH